ncbi:MAG: redoxin domain-containing protein [Methyloprofundus sp.]|nr:redoxin domain-containing protein [Methyloprofundus sp.]
MKYLKELLLILAVFSVFQTLTQSSMRTGSLPKLPLQTMTGEATATLLRNQPSVIYFWGSWCGICSTIQGTISAVAEDYPVLTVALRSGSDREVSAYLQQNNLAWQVLNDANGDLAQTFGVDAVPALFIIAENGEISSVSRGYISEVGLRLRLWWAGLNF